MRFHRSPLSVGVAKLRWPNEWMRKKKKRKQTFNRQTIQRLLYIKWITNVHFRFTVSLTQPSKDSSAELRFLLSVHFYCLNSSYVCLCKSMFTTSINVAPKLCPILPYLIVIYFHCLPFLPFFHSLCHSHSHSCSVRLSAM